MAGTQTDYFDAEPNVFVAHLRDGLEVVSLHTGRTICKLHLASPGLHLDLNGDGVLDHIQAAGTWQTSCIDRCTHIHVSLEPCLQALGLHALHACEPVCSWLRWLRFASCFWQDTLLVLKPWAVEPA